MWSFEQVRNLRFLAQCLTHKTHKASTQLFFKKKVNLKFFHFINSILWIHEKQTLQEKTLQPEHGKRTTQWQYESPHDETGEGSLPARYVLWGIARKNVTVWYSVLNSRFSVVLHEITMQSLAKSCWFDLERKSIFFNRFTLLIVFCLFV